MHSHFLDTGASARTCTFYSQWLAADTEVIHVADHTTAHTVTTVLKKSLLVT